MSTPRLIDNPRDLPAVARAIEAGRGPVAIDTERASGYRYSDDAYLVQIYRRDAGTFLVDPHGQREDVARILAPALNPLTWILHSAPNDLPCLLALGLTPAHLFDTELAGRLAGLEKVNLGAMVELFTGVALPKGHGYEDWSTRPLPESWLRYAADDVLYLVDVAEAVTELLDSKGLLDIAEQEFDHIVDTHRRPPQPSSWRDIRGASTLRKPEQLAVLRHLATVRDEIGRRDDRAVSRVLATKTMVDLARRLPRTPRELGRINGGHRLYDDLARFWLAEIAEARRTDPASWPEPAQRGGSVPSTSVWPEVDPWSWDVLVHVREDIAALSEKTGVPVENLLKPTLLKSSVWQLRDGGELQSASQLRDYLAAQGAREWQIEMIVPLVVARAF